jgi:hypothetical protein
MTELQADQNPILQRGAQFLLAGAQRLAKRRHAWQLGDFAGKRPIVQLVLMRQRQRRFNVCRQ